MRAVVYTKFGAPDVLQLKKVEEPTPNEDEVLIKIHAASVNAYDWHFLTADIFLIRLMGGGLLRPKDTRLGADMGGRIEAGGKLIGYLGEIHPQTMQNYKLPDKPLAAAIIDIEVLLEGVDDLFSVEAIPDQPPVLEDLALVVDDLLEFPHAGVRKALPPQDNQAAYL